MVFLNIAPLVQISSSALTTGLYVYSHGSKWLLSWKPGFVTRLWWGESLCCLGWVGLGWLGVWRDVRMCQCNRLNVSTLRVRDLLTVRVWCVCVYHDTWMRTDRVRLQWYGGVSLIMAALRSRCGHYIFVVVSFFFLLFFSPNLSDHRLDVYAFALTPHYWCGLSANLE